MIGPISIPQTSSIIVMPTIQIITPETLLSHKLIAGVIQVLSPNKENRGFVILARALKIV